MKEIKEKINDKFHGESLVIFEIGVLSWEREGTVEPRKQEHTFLKDRLARLL